MRCLRLAGCASLVFTALAAPSFAGLVLVAGTGPPTLATNTYGFDGTYFDLKGPGGSSERVSHPGGGAVAFLYVFKADGGISTYFDSTAGPYDGADDTQVGILNNSSVVVNSLSLKGAVNTFGFDLDGIDSSPFNAPGNSSDSTGYGGPKTFFTNLSADRSAGTLNFIGGLAAGGGTTYASLELAPTISAPGAVVPEPSSLLMAGGGLAGVLCCLGRRPAPPRRPA